MVAQVPASRFKDFRAFLGDQGFVFETRAHQVFLARKNSTVVNLYESGKVVLGGPEGELRDAVEAFVSSIGGDAAENRSEFHGPRIGIDEVGKGDYFGPLVVCAAFVDEAREKGLQEIGVRDSKDLSPEAIRRISERIRTEILPRDAWSVVRISPWRYNQLHAKMENVNKILGWGHATALENVLEAGNPAQMAISDKFGDEHFIEESLKSKGRGIRLVQTTKGERDIAVATASILARDGFIAMMEIMRSEFSERFPLGASNVEGFGRDLVARKGAEILLQTAKVHFATTRRIVTDEKILDGLRRKAAAQK